MVDGVTEWRRANREEYGAGGDALPWLDEDTRAAATEERTTLLAALAARGGSLSSGGTKPHLGPLSPGCASCAAGTWSCLFVNGRCNAACFFCPAEQSRIGEPTTSTVAFPNPRDYVAYVERLGVRGVGLSGGEPLLTFDRTLDIARRLRRRFPPEALHLWVYTNGLLADREKMTRLRDAGVDEVRFDLCASGYDLGRLATAVGLIPTVTVEIPAIPEHEARLRDLLAPLSDAGVAFLNLHQLRLTPHNLRHLRTRPYTFLHGPRVTVLESELMALRLLRHAAERGVGPPIHYCSFTYKHRYQALGARLRLAPPARRPHEEVTATGYVRSLIVRGDGEALRRGADALTTHGVPPEEWAWSPAKDGLLLRAAHLPHLPPELLPARASYFRPVLRTSLSYRHSHVDLPLGRGPKGRTLVIERVLEVSEVPLDRATRDQPPFGETETGLLPYD